MSGCSTGCGHNWAARSRETLAFLYKLDGYADRHGFKDGQAEIRVGAGISLLDNHYRRQTAAWMRLNHLKDAIK